MRFKILRKPSKTLLEVYESLPEGTLAELVNNQLVMEPAPDFGHQDVVTQLVRVLSNHVVENSLGKVIVSPVDVYFDGENVFQPDIIFIAADRLPLLVRKGRVHGAPDLVIEVLAPGTERKDKRKKKPVYEKHGVKEFWLVDPETKDVLVYGLKGNVFAEAASQPGVVVSPLLNTTIRF